jgi:hypothetical protein
VIKDEGIPYDGKGNFQMAAIFAKSRVPRQFLDMADKGPNKHLPSVLKLLFVCSPQGFTASMGSKVNVSGHFLFVQTFLNQVIFEFLEQRKVEFSLKKPCHFSEFYFRKIRKKLLNSKSSGCRKIYAFLF